MKWVSKGRKKKYSAKRFFKGFNFAFKGIIAAFKTEQNLLIQLIIGIIVVIGGLLLKITNVELSLIILGIGLVMAMELANTAIEYAVDMAMSEVHPLAKMSKDIAEGSVLFLSIIVFIVVLIIYIPKIINLFN